MRWTVTRSSTKWWMFRSLAVAMVLSGVGVGGGVGAGGCIGGGGGGASGSTVGGGGGAAPPAGLQGSGKPIAKVGDGAVSESEFAAAASRVQQAGHEMPIAERKEVLDKLVVEEVLFQEAAAKGLYRDPKVRKIMVNLLLREEVYNDVRAADISQDELQAYYEAHQSEFTVPEKIQVKRIYIKYGGDSNRTTSEAMALAKELAGKIKRDPTAFGGLAEQYSDDPYKRRGGDLGYVAHDGKPGVPPEVIEKAFSMPVGQISEPFDAGGGANLVLVAAKRAAVERTFDQMKGSVLRRLKNEKFQALTDSYIERVRGKYDVQIDEAALAAITIEARPLPSGIDPTAVLPGVGPRPDRLGEDEFDAIEGGPEVEPQ